MKDLRNEEAFRSADVYLFDLDGCIYHTDRPAPGAMELIRQLEHDGNRVGFLTNNSRESAAEIAAKVQAMGISVQERQIVTATETVGEFMKARFGTVSAAIAGSSGLARAVERCGHSLVELAGREFADVVVIGRDTAFTFDKLQSIVDRVESGAKLVAANPDSWHPGPNGRKVVETGALLASVLAITGQAPEFAGKPAPFIFEFALHKLGATTQSCVMIGDNLSTDIAGGAAAGMATVWISSPETGTDNIGPSTMSPDLIVDGLEMLLAIYRQEPYVQTGR